VERLLATLAQELGTPVTLQVYGDRRRPGRHEVAIRLRSGGALGALSAPGGFPEGRAQELADRAADLIGERLEHEAATRRQRQQRETEVREVLEGDRLAMRYQPIVALSDGRLVGVEALARFPDRHEPVSPTGGPLPPDRWFAEASAVGLGIDLEVSAIRQALEEFEALPKSFYLSVNVSPETAVSPALRRALRGTQLDRLVFEITEHAVVTDYDALRASLRPYRKRGLRLAVDDAGAGFASLRHILRMSPEVIKLDRSLTRGLDRDAVLRALTYSIAAFASATDAAVIAEGIENEGELDALRFLGVELGQGYHLCRPGDARSIAALGTAIELYAEPRRVRRADR
jgi:EAL domain-containing protein (putative c-di-GMP-specific phosphodiesterase class I)